MALMDCFYFFFAVLAVALAFMSYFWFPLSYIAALLLILMFILLFWSIPLKLNWSSNFYGHLFWRFMSFLFLMLFVYAICYYLVGFERSDGTTPNFLEAIYFSITSFTTVQYGEYHPLAQSRILVCIESLMGIIAFIPFFAAFGWLYCQNRLWSESLERKAIPEDFAVTPDPVTGGWREAKNERTQAEAEELNNRIKCMPCSRCGSSNPKIEKIYDIIGRTTSLPLYVAYCSCGQISKPSTTAFLAAWRWKRLNKKKPKNNKKPVHIRQTFISSVILFCVIRVSVIFYKIWSFIYDTVMIYIFHKSQKK